MSVILNRVGKLEYLRAEGIAVPHGFTTRLGGVSQGHLASLNLGMHRGDAPGNVEENFRILGSAIGFSPADVVMTWQIHSDVVRQVGRQDCNGLDHRNYPQCDALITRDPGVALWVFSADCTPILFHDPVTGAVGSAHAGWRGTAAAIAAKTVSAMVSAFGCKPEDIRAAIGPNIGGCCFQTDADVPHAMVAAYGKDALSYIRKEDQKYYVNLKEMNALALRSVGVTQIEICPLCTACRQDLFWSHRKMGDQRGSQGAVIVCKEVCP